MKLIFLIFFALNARAQMICQDDLYKSIAFKKLKIKVCDKEIEVEVADNDALRSVGLMCRDNLAPDKGMLFIFETPMKASFWMKNTKIPLSIAFFTKDKKLSNIDNMQALDEDNMHKSKGLALYSLEMNLGWFTKNKIKTGCKLSLK